MIATEVQVPVRLRLDCCTSKLHDLPGRRQLDERLSERTHHLRNLQEQIHVLYLDLQALVQEQKLTELEIKEINHSIGTPHVVPHPVHRLPHALLRRIFNLCCNHTDFEGLSDAPQDALTFSWRIGQVCRRWRSVALATPQLWSTVCLNNNTLSNPYLAELVEEQLVRSHDTELSVYVNSRRTLTAEAFPVLDVLLSSSPRWKELFLWVSFPSLDAFSPIAGAIQSLATLRMFCWETPALLHAAAIEDSSLCDMFLDAPALHTVIGSPLILQHCQLPWAQIKTYRSMTSTGLYSMAGYRGYLKVLSKTPKLRVAHIDSYKSWNFETFARTKLSNLHSLVLQEYIEDIEDGSSFQVLEHLTLPALRNLQIKGLVDVNRVRSLLTRSQSPRLTHLTLTSTTLTAEDCVKLLSTIPSLTLLQLECPSLSTTHLLAQLLELKLVPALNFLIIKTRAVSDMGVLQRLRSSRPALQIRYDSALAHLRRSSTMSRRSYSSDR